MSDEMKYSLPHRCMALYFPRDLLPEIRQPGGSEWLTRCKFVFPLVRSSPLESCTKSLSWAFYQYLTTLSMQGN